MLKLITRHVEDFYARCALCARYNGQLQGAEEFKGGINKGRRQYINRDLIAIDLLIFIPFYDGLTYATG